MEIVALGHNHDTASIELREKFAFSSNELKSALSRLRTRTGIIESAIISTCNRNEIYGVVPNQEALSDLIDFFHDFHCIDRGIAGQSLYTLERENAVRHLFSVASGIDSMVVGETQIANQLKSAYHEAREQANTGPILNRLFISAFETGRKVRSLTKIAEGQVSISSCAVQLARKIYSDLSDKTTVLVGAGDNSEQTAVHLLDHGATDFIVANRTIERATALADKLNGVGIGLDQLHGSLLKADIVITSTAASGYLLTASDLKPLMASRRNAPIFIIDLSVPRVIDPQARGMYNVFLYDIGDLTSITDENRRKREQEVEKASTMIESEVTSFMRWYRSLGAKPTVVDLRNAFEKIRADEVMKLNNKLSGDESSRLESFSKQLINKLLHRPTEEIKQSVETGDSSYITHAVRRLFDLGNNEEIDDE